MTLNHDGSWWGWSFEYGNHDGFGDYDEDDGGVTKIMDYDKDDLVAAAGATSSRPLKVLPGPRKCSPQLHDLSHLGMISVMTKNTGADSRFPSWLASPGLAICVSTITRISLVRHHKHEHHHYHHVGLGHEKPQHEHKQHQNRSPHFHHYKIDHQHHLLLPIGPKSVGEWVSESFIISDLEIAIASPSFPNLFTLYFLKLFLRFILLLSRSLYVGGYRSHICCCAEIFVNYFWAEIFVNILCVISLLK